MHEVNLTAAEALEKLKRGNQNYLEAASNPGDVSPQIRKKTCEEGQVPYAVVVTCSDSRVIPESIFCAGIGELFVIRVAGNVMDNHQLGSIEYAVDHLGTNLVVILGHTNCGAVGAAMGGPVPSGYIKYITEEIRKAIGEEKDAVRASCLNLERSVAIARKKLCYGEDSDIKVCGALYHIDSGKVEFMDC